MWRISWRSLTKAVANLCTVLQTTEVSKLLLLKPLLLRIFAENSPVKLSRFTRYSLIIACDLKERFSLCKVHIFWEGKKFLQNLHLIFDRYFIGQIYGGDFAKFCCLLRIYELYIKKSWGPIMSNFWGRVQNFFEKTCVLTGKLHNIFFQNFFLK